MPWVAYRDRMHVAGKRVRVRGNPGSFNEGTNKFDAKTYRLPAGLVGKVDSQSPCPITFDSTEDRNSALWRQIQPTWQQSKLFCVIHPTRWVGMEVEQ